MTRNYLAFPTWHSELVSAQDYILSRVIDTGLSRWGVNKKHCLWLCMPPNPLYMKSALNTSTLWNILALTYSTWKAANWFLLCSNNSMEAPALLVLSFET